MADAVQAFSQHLQSEVFRKVIPFGVIAIFAGILFKALERWTLRKISDWKQRTQRAKQERTNEFLRSGEFCGHTTSDCVDTPLCPICNVPMVKRTARRGESAGTQFWGCIGYPKCKGTRDCEPCNRV